MQIQHSKFQTEAQPVAGEAQPPPSGIVAAVAGDLDEAALGALDHAVEVFLVLDHNRGVARYLHQLDSADRQDPSLSRTAKIDHLNDKVTKLKAEMERLAALEEEMLGRPEQ